MIEDIAAATGTVATMTDLLRLRQGPFEVADCIALSECSSMDTLRRHVDYCTEALLLRKGGKEAAALASVPVA